MKRLRNNAGLTLLEILIASVVGIIATAAAVELYIHQHKNWIIQENVSDLQQNGRAVIDEMSSKIRMAGYGVPEGLEAVISRQASGTADSDSITIVYLHEPVCTTSSIAPMTLPSDEIMCGDVSSFETDQWCYIWDPNTKTGEFFMISGVQQSSNEIEHSTASLSTTYPANSKLYIFDVVRYFIDDWSDTAHPILMRQMHNDWPDIYADNISDLNIEYHLTDGTVVDTVNMSQYIRQVDIEVVARTKREDLLLEDYRYDTLRTSVQVRNLAL